MNASHEAKSDVYVGEINRSRVTESDDTGKALVYSPMLERAELSQTLRADIGIVRSAARLGT